MAKKNKKSAAGQLKWVAAPLKAQSVHEMPKGAKGAAALAASVKLSDETDEVEMKKWWLAVSLAARQFGNGQTLDPEKDISAQTGTSAGAQAVASVANNTLFGACPLWDLQWDWVTSQEVGECGVVRAYVALLIANMVAV